MADFGARFTDGTSLETWRDPAGERSTPLDGIPSRINPMALRPHKYRRAFTEDPVELSAVVDGVEGPLDAALDGRLFYGWWIEYPSAAAPPVSVPPGQSSVRTFTPHTPGHYTYMLRRTGGGGIILHIDVIEFEVS